VGPFVEGGCAGSEGFDRKYVGPEVTLDPQLGGIRPAWEAYVDAVAGTEIGLFALTGMLSQAIYQFTLGVENFMLATYDEPEFVAHLLDESMGFHRKIVEFLCDYPLDVLYLADDVAFRNGLMINPEHFKRMWIPRMKHVMEPAEQKGIPIIFHSDGTLYDLIPSLIEMGFTCLNPIEPYGMDILEVKRRWGNDIALMGNFDIAGTLAFGTPDEVRQEVSEALPALKAGGRYIAASSHSITSAVPPENFLAMLDVVHTEGSYGT
jgi:uroporphyrinogen decarboxylase